jgi:hypothetical protein
MIIFRFEKTTDERDGPFGGDHGTQPSLAYDKVATSLGFSSAYDGPTLFNHTEEGTDAHKHVITAGLKGFHFGFESLEQLDDWFSCPEGRQAMEEKGCKLFKFSVPDDYVLRGSHQVLFRRDKADSRQEFDAVHYLPREQPVYATDEDLSP